MIKLLVVGLLALAGRAQAQPATYNQKCNQVAISSSTPTEITGNLAYQSANVWSVKVSNLDATSNICCSQDPAVTCALGAHHGETIAPSATPPYNFLSWIINTTQGWYCKNSSGSAPVNAEICLTSGIN